MVMSFMEVDMAKGIMVVDDEADFVGGISQLLERAGYDADAAYNGDEALKKIAIRKYDLATLDITMPGMDGLDVLRERGKSENDRIKNVPVVIISAVSGNADILRGIRLEKKL